MRAPSVIVDNLYVPRIPGQIEKIGSGGQNVQTALRSFLNGAKSAAPKTLKYVLSGFVAKAPDQV
jgi:hypothetical protein